MKETICMYALFLMGIAASQGQNEPCQEVNLANDPAKRNVLREFINEAVANNDFRDDKGVVRLTVYEDRQGLTRWILSTTINDGFLNVNPPTKYFDFMGDLVLVWEADSEGRRLQSKGDTAAIKRCLRARITDRLYIQPPRQHRWTSQRMPNGIPVNPEGQRRGRTGGGYEIIFNKDGTYQKKPLA